MTNILERNHVTVVGAGGPTLLLAHGLGCDQGVWQRLAPLLARKNRVVTFDYVGAGKSQHAAWDPDRYRTLRGYAQDVREICDALALDDVVFLGHSISGMIGVELALADPGRLRGLVMIASSPRYLDDAASDYRGGFGSSDVDELFDLMEHNFLGWSGTVAGLAADHHPEFTRELRDTFGVNDPRTLRLFAEATFRCDLRDRLPQVTVPAFVLYCSRDHIAPVSVGRYLCQHLPRATGREIDVTGHIPHMSHPQLVEETLRPWIDGLPAAT